MLNPFGDMAAFTMNPFAPPPGTPMPDLANPFAPPKGMPGMDVLNGGSDGMPGWDDFMGSVKNPTAGATSAVESVAPVGNVASSAGNKLGIK